MKIVALEFSSLQRSVAVLDTPDSGGSTEAEVVETGLTENRPLGMVEQALREAGLEREQIELLVIGLGPGSYTGIRAAIALGQGWQLARGVKLLGISSAECIAAQAQTDGLRGPVAVIIDAQRNEFYHARYELTDEGRRELAPLKLVTPAEVKANLAGQILIGPEATKWFADGRQVFPRALTLARLAFGRTDFVPGEELEPIYLRETKFVKAPPPRQIG